MRYIIGERKKPAWSITSQIKLMSLNLTFKTERISENPNAKKNTSISKRGNNNEVNGGTNWNKAKKKPKAANSNIIIINAVKVELKTTISLRKYTFWIIPAFSTRLDIPIEVPLENIYQIINPKSRYKG